MKPFSLSQYDITVSRVLRNASPAMLYEEALKMEPGSVISDAGALVCDSTPKTGRSPNDKRIVVDDETKSDIWWGKVNIEMDHHVFLTNRERAIDYLNTQETLYVVDGYAGADPRYQIKVRVVATRAYHALFMHNMLIRPTTQQLDTFGEPDFIIFNAGKFSANRHTAQMTSKTSIGLSFKDKELVILGTEYAGEMKKGVFTVLNYLMPKREVLSMHCSANEGKTGDVTLFFGLSGTGKTTLSADPARALIGDDEHCWTDQGVCNIEGGCYAKAINLSAEKEPEIYNAIRFGSVLENVVIDRDTRHVDYNDNSITENTRASYPIDFIPNAKVPSVGGHPKNIVFLSCDAFGVLPPVSRLNPSQAMYHFISGYTSKVAGTEMGVTEPQATFSACFGAAFIVWHPSKYAELLAEQMRKHSTNLWLVNTGWTGGGYGVGKRMSLPATRAIIDAIHDGSLSKAPMMVDSIFGFEVPTECKGVEAKLLVPRNAWADGNNYDAAAQKLAGLFSANFKQFAEGCSDEILGAAPKVG
jgi:phosphoenolpyruvate carboxykinase (ATP)